MNIGSLKLGTGVANGATTTKTHEDVGKDAERPDVATSSREGATSRPESEDTLEKPAETEEEVATRLDRTQPVSGDSSVAGKTPEKVFLDPPTPAEDRKNTLESDEVAKPKPPSEAPAQPTADDGIVRFSSHPILKFKVGRFRFEDGLLKLDNEQDIADFRKTLSELPRAEQLRIKELDLSAAEAQVRAVLANSPKASKGIGSDTGGRDPGKQVGKGQLGDSHGE